MSEAHDGAPQGVTEDTAAADQVAEETLAQGDEHTGDDAPAPEPETPEQARKRTARERVEQAVARQREAERDAEYWKAKALQATPQPAEQAQQQPQGDGRPVRDEFEDDFEYIEALTDWKAEQAAERLAQRNQQRDRERAVRDNFETRKKELFPEGESPGLEAFLRIETLPLSVIEIVGDSDIGPKIAEHLGANPAELRRLEAMNVIQQARELTRLEQRLAGPARPTPKTATDAPDPPPQARGSGGRFTVAPDTDDFEAFEKQYGK